MSPVVAGILVFLCAVGYDASFAAYVRSASTGRAARAALWSGVTYLVGLVGLVAILRGSLWFALPELAGLAVGTYLGVMFTRDVD